MHEYLTNSDELDESELPSLSAQLHFHKFS
jgi:hypothetical protein